jgi:Fe-S cluster assembly protein SufD
VGETERLLERARALAGRGPAWIDALREAGIRAFERAGLPTTRLEDWKYTNVTALLRTAFVANVPETRSSDVAGLLPAAGIGGVRPIRLVFADGVFAPELSSRGTLPDGLVVESLAARWGDGAASVRLHLGRLAPLESDAFVALNAAHLADGALVEIASGAILDVPIEVVFLNESIEPLFVHPRILVVAGEGSRATLVETHLGRGPAPYASNAVTEVVLGRGAELRHVRVQREGDEAIHLATVAVRQEKESRYVSTAFAIGAALSRTALGSTLVGEGASCTLDGLYLGRAQQHVDHHTSIDHTCPGTTSRQLYKGILTERATGVFNGKVVVRVDAQRTDAGQVNRNLLLSETANLFTKPELQILADDVKCAHGATIGRLDENSVFYLRSRGIGEEDARRLLLYAFASEIVDRVPVEGLRERLVDEIWGRFGDPRAGESPR